MKCPGTISAVCCLLLSSVHLSSQTATVYLAIDLRLLYKFLLDKKTKIELWPKTWQKDKVNLLSVL